VGPLAAGGKKVEVKFTLTAPGCGMGDVLKQDIESKLLSVPDVEEVEVEVVLDPPWDASRMSDAAKLQLGML
jgi:metal-sulfur cluster biosynthetic enzyme